MRDEWHRDRRMRGKVTAFTCSAAGLLSTVLHLYSSYKAFVEANPRRFSPWAQFTYFSPWRHEHNSLKTTAFYVLGTLGDHPWINALAWDVLFSIISLCAYSAASRADTRGMLQCSIAPWLDDFIEAAKQVAELPKDGIEWAMAHDFPRKAAKQLSIGQQYMKDYYKTSPERWKVYKKKMLPEDYEDSDDEANGYSDEDLAEPVQSTRALRSQTRSAANATQPVRRSTKGSGDKGRKTQESSTGVSRKASGSRSAPRLKSARPESRKKPAEEDRGPQDSSQISPNDDNLEGRAEQAGVAWCLYVVGGLGLASAAVFGADVLP